MHNNYSIVELKSSLKNAACVIDYDKLTVTDR